MGFPAAETANNPQVAEARAVATATASTTSGQNKGKADREEVVAVRRDCDIHLCKGGGIVKTGVSGSKRASKGCGGGEGLLPLPQLRSSGDSRNKRADNPEKTNHGGNQTKLIGGLNGGGRGGGTVEKTGGCPWEDVHTRHATAA